MPTATAYAQRIRITDQLDSNLDPRTFRLKEIGFGKYRITVPQNRAFFQQRVQLGEEFNNLLADVSAGVDISTGNVSWTLTAIDPETGEQPNSADLGLLAPNNAENDGQGFVTYTIRPKSSAPTGTVIENKATIIFDTEEPIVTNTVTNTLDADIPSSQIAPLPMTSANTTFTVNWSGSDLDEGSGLATYDVWVSEDNSPYVIFQTATTETNAQFTGTPGKTYRFYSIARDNAGNVEAAPDVPDATTRIPIQCAVTINPTSVNFSAAGNTGSFTISAESTCTWSVTTNDTWITITQGSTGNGNGTVNYSVTANTGAQRTGTIIVNDQIFTITQGAGNLSISGNIAYANTPANQPARFLAGVTLAAAGTPPGAAATDASGNYNLANLGNDAYTVTPSKTGEINGISSLDASRIQQHLVGITTLNSNQLVAADVNNSGTVTSLDASRIQQYLVGLQSANIIGQWKFLPANRQYAPLTGSVTGENYQGVLVGEVSGNWMPVSMLSGRVSDEKQNDEELAETRFSEITEAVKRTVFSPTAIDGKVVRVEPKEEVSGNGISVTLPVNANSSNGSTVTIPITVSNLAGNTIESFDFSLFYDPAVLQPATPVGSNAGTLSASCSVLANSPTPGRVVVSGACGNPPITSGEGVLYNLRFNVIGAPNQQTALSFVNPQGGQNTFLFNDGDPQAKTTNGSFTVTGPTAANVTISGRVQTVNGRGIENAFVTLTDSQGVARTARTSTFGNFIFNEVTAGQICTLSVRAKNYQFNQSTLVIDVTGDLTGLIFEATR